MEALPEIATATRRRIEQGSVPHSGDCFFYQSLKVHKIEIFFGFDFEICIISLLVM